MNLVPRQKISNPIQGFSLVEVLVYISVFTIVSVGSVGVLFSLQEMVYEHRTNQVMTRNVTSVFERVLFDVRAADSVNVGASTLGSDPGALTLVAGATTTEYTLSGGALLVSVNGGAANPITGDNTTVTNLQFDHYDNTVSEAVRVSITFQADWGNVTKIRNFTNSSVLLSSYD